MKTTATAALLACLALAACKADGDGPLTPPEPAVAGGALAADSTIDDDLVCQWGPVEGQEGVWEVLCHRADDDASGLCRYLVTYRCTAGLREAGVCTKVGEEFLGCEGGNDDTECDNEIQNEIFKEYDSSQPHGGHGQIPPASPTCEDIEHHASGHDMAINLTWGELNGYFQDGNPHRSNGGGWGWVQSDIASGLQELRNDWAADSPGGVYGHALPLSSGYRCPHGNASMPNAVNNSYHMAGLAADISVRTIAQRHDDWGSFNSTQKDAKYKEVWDKLDELSDDVNESQIQRRPEARTNGTRGEPSRAPFPWKSARPRSGKPCARRCAGPSMKTRSGARASQF